MELGRIDAALVSHLHFDHLDLPSLRMLGTDVTVVVPVGARRLVRRFADVREVDVGDEVRIGDVTILAVPAAHSGGRHMLRPAPSLGFVMSGSRRIYFAGDYMTDLSSGMNGAFDSAREVATALHARAAARA